MNDYAFLDDFARREGCELLRDEPLSRHTTFRIGGPADRMIKVTDRKQLISLLAELEQRELPRMVLGNGSNLLVSDKGFRGVMIVLDGAFRAIAMTSGEGGAKITAGAGASLSSVCVFARDHGLSGLEFAWGIPGSVGGAVYMNAGAYGGEIKDVLARVTDTAGGSFTGRDPGFGYRRSPYKSGETRGIICSAEFSLTPCGQEIIAGKMEEQMARRKEKQPYDMPSAGSIFKRPQNGYAAALIEECGLKGRTVGGAQVSPKHAGFIVNVGGASCGDVLELIGIIQKEVREKTGVSLEREVIVTGEL